MYRIKEIKKLLAKHNYVPVIKKIGDGVVINFPAPKLMASPKIPLVEAYAIKRGKESGLFYNTDVSPEEKFVSLPEYAIRLFVMADISACCGRIPISDHLIRYIDEKEVEYEELEGIVDSPTNEEDCSKEGFLTKLFIEARSSGFPREFEEVAHAHGVYEGYRIIKSFF